MFLFSWFYYYVSFLLISDKKILLVFKIEFLPCLLLAFLSSWYFDMTCAIVTGALKSMQVDVRMEVKLSRMTTSTQNVLPFILTHLCYWSWKLKLNLRKNLNVGMIFLSSAFWRRVRVVAGARGSTTIWRPLLHAIPRAGGRETTDSTSHRWRD